MTSKSKRLTYLTITLGVLVLLIAGYAFNISISSFKADRDVGGRRQRGRLGS